VNKTLLSVVPSRTDTGGLDGAAGWRRPEDRLAPLTIATLGP